MHRVSGARDGASAFPRVDYPQLKPKLAGEVDFGHYHTYDETVGLLRGWAAKYPDLVELHAVGQSFEGRDIWQLTIASRKHRQHRAFVFVLTRLLVERFVIVDAPAGQRPKTLVRHVVAPYEAGL